MSPKGCQTTANASTRPIARPFKPNIGGEGKHRNMARGGWDDGDHDRGVHRRVIVSSISSAYKQFEWEFKAIKLADSQQVNPIDHLGLYAISNESTVPNM